MKQEPTGPSRRLAGGISARQGREGVKTPHNAQQQQPWHYKLPLFIFAVCVIILAGKTAGGAFDWLLGPAFGSDPVPITTIYAPTHQDR